MNGGNLSSPSDSTSQSLLERAKQHDAAAWAKLSHVYGPLVYQWCRRAGLQTSDSADVAQEVFRAVFTAIDGFRKERPEDSFRGWLWTIARNKVRDHFRAAQRQPQPRGGSTVQVAAQQLPGTVPEEGETDSSQKLHSKLARRAVELMRGDFEERTWLAFWLTAVEEQPPADVAERLEMSVAAVYKAKSRVLRRLRQALDGLDLVQ